MRRAAVDDPTVVLDAALRFLETRPRSVAEVRRRLTEAGYQEVLVTPAVERLTEIGVLDDEAFARQWVESRDRARPRGERALQRELWLKGISGETIERVLSDRRANPGAAPGDTALEPSVSPDEAAARRVIERHTASLDRVADPRRRRQKAYALLARKGFDPELAGLVAREFTDTSTPDE